MDAFLKRQPKPAGGAAAKADVEMSETTAPKKPRYVPWIEKYRPTKVEEVSHQLEVVQALKHSITTGQVPHLLLHGPPGTGKTSTILALSKDLFGVPFYKQRVLELNASDDRGIAIVREKVKKFAQRKIARHPDGREVPQLQFIILDEADSMTHDAQFALRRIIEAYSGTTRFCIICNYISKIIDPLASRCVKFRFAPISHEAQLARLSNICEVENVKLNSDDVLDKLIAITEGDLRRSINNLQTCASFCREKGIGADDIESISGIVPNKAINQINMVVSTKGASYHDIQRLAEFITLEGFDIQQLFSQLLDFFLVAPTNKISDLKKARVSELIAQTEFQLITGGNEELNLLNTLSQISSVLTS